MKYNYKFFLILFLSILNVYEAKTQGYLPMLNDSLYWDVAYYDMNVIICTEFGNQGAGPYRYSLDGDSTINGTVYKKFKSNSFYTLQPQPSPNCSPFAVDTIPSPSWNIYSLMREDTINKKVYKYDVVNAQEYLWYDFDAQTGDTIIYPELGIFVIDTIYNIITSDGKTRKFFGCNTSTNILCAYYIEGLGGKGGPFHEPFDIFEMGPWLMCISDLNQNAIYSPDGFSNCYYFSTGIEQISNSPDNIILHPNPVEDKLIIDNLPPDTNVMLYDNFGKLIMHYNNILINQVDVSALVPGMYFVCFDSRNKTRSFRKFIKQ